MSLALPMGMPFDDAPAGVGAGAEVAEAGGAATRGADGGAASGAADLPTWRVNPRHGSHERA